MVPQQDRFSKAEVGFLPQLIGQSNRFFAPFILAQSIDETVASSSRTQKD